MKTIYKTIIALAILAVLALGLWIWLSPKASRVTVSPAMIEDVKQMVQLSTLRIYEEVPVKGKVGSRHLVAKLALEGSVDFDLEKLRFEEKGDTVTVTLPPEIVTLRESTRPGSYVVIDTWNDNFFGSGNISVKEENRMKELTLENAKKQLYAKGCVRQVRADAVRSVRSLLSAAMPGKTVIVLDPQSVPSRRTE